MPAKKNKRKRVQNRNNNRRVLNKPLERKRTTMERILEPIDSDKFFARNLWFIVAFAVPFLMMLLCFALMKVAPFGEEQILATDEFHQYYPFLVDFHDKLQSGGSWLWSWKSGGGVNYLSLMAYYLASPLNLLSIIVPAEYLREFLMLITCAKVGFASLFFAHFIRITFHKRDISVAAFGIMYGLCAFMSGYYWNIIWMDSVALLPLVVAGAISILRDGKFRLYVIALALAIMANYYIGLFVCIFVVFVCIAYCIVEFTSFKDLIMKFFKMLGYSSLSISITAMLTLPTLIAFTFTQSSVEPGTSYSNTPPEGLALYFGQIAEDASFTDIIKELLSGFKYTLANTVNFVSPNVKNMKLPNIYCGIATVVLATMYFTCGKIKIREKIVAAVTCLIFYLSFTIKWLDFIWHGFHFPNMIEYRYAFLLSFVMLTMAYRLYMNLDSIKLINIIVTVVMVFIMFSIIFIEDAKTKASQIGINLERETEYKGENREAYLDKLADIVVYGAILITFLLLMWIMMRSLDVVPKNALAIALVIICIAEGFCSVYFGTQKNGTTARATYPLGAQDTINCVEKIDELEENNPELVRSEVTKTYTLNDNALIGINGVTMFSSMANSSVTGYMNSIGLSAKVSSNRYAYIESSPVTNMLLNIKYLVSVQSKHLDRIHNSEVYASGEVNPSAPVKLLRNNYHLPVGYVVNDDVLQYDTKTASNNPIINQNRLISNAYGTTESIYEDMTSEGPVYDTMTKHTNNYFSYTSQATEAAVEFVAPRSGTAVAYFKCSDTKKVTIRNNGRIVNTNDITFPYLMLVGDVQKGDRIKMTAVLNSNHNRGSVEAYCAMLNEELYRSVFTKFKANSLTATKTTDTCIEGTVNAHYDGLFLTSIPYDGGWKAYVDGEQVEITPLADAQIAFRIPKGQHEIELRYTPKGFVVGMTVSILGLLIFAALIIWTTRKEWVLNLIKRTPKEDIVEETVAVSDQTSDQTEE